MVVFFIKFILLAVFNVSFFTITKATCTFSMWISYAFIHFSFLMFFLSPLFIRNSKNSRHVAIKSITLITAIYFIVTLGIGIFFLFNPILVVFQYSVETIVTGIYFIILIITISINNKIASDEITFSKEKMFLNNIFVKAEFLKSKLTDSDLRTELEKLQEESKYSPTKSSDAVKETENQIISLLDEITLNVEKQKEEEYFSKIINCRNLLKQRNLKLRK